MKRTLFMAAAALIISGTVWGQTPPPATQSFTGDIFDLGNAVPALSTEARYSAGQFTTDVDNFISVNDYDPEIGTFFFLGGFPDDVNVDATDILGSNNVISFGFGKTLNNGYLGIYYGGNLIRSRGYHDEEKPGDDVIKSDSSNATWFNRVAILYGTSNLGAFRFDLIEDSSVHRRITVNEKIQREAIGGPIVALTWGSNIDEGALNGLGFYATLGVDFPDQVTTGDRNDKGEYVYQLVRNTGGAFFIQAGAAHDSGIWGDLSFVLGFADTEKGDQAGSDPAKAVSKDYTEAGDFAIGLRGGYSASIELGKVSIGIGPGLELGLISEDNKITGKDFDDTKLDYEDLNKTYFQLKTTIDLGIKFQINEKFALYTGASLQLFDWQTAANSGGDKELQPNDKDSSWSFEGILWQNAKWTGSDNLGFGLTFKPAENVVIGAGLNAWLDRLFTLNLATMQFETGSAWAAPASNIGSWAGNLLFGNGVTFDLTASVKF